MMLSGIVAEDFVNYRKPSMFLGAARCDFKCCKEGGFPLSVCQNHQLDRVPLTDISPESLYSLYARNDITHAVVFGGLEPMLQFSEMEDVIRYFREQGCMDDVVIYTGYTPQEVQHEIDALCQFPNIIVKFGRYKPDENPHYDAVLGVTLASNNQYAVRIS